MTQRAKRARETRIRRGLEVRARALHEKLNPIRQELAGRMWEGNGLTEEERDRLDEMQEVCGHLIEIFVPSARLTGDAALIELWELRTK